MFLFPPFLTHAGHTGSASTRKRWNHERTRRTGCLRQEQWQHRRNPRRCHAVLPTNVVRHFGGCCCCCYCCWLTRCLLLVCDTNRSGKLTTPTSATQRPFQDIVLNRDEDSELRISAYVTMMKCPTSVFVSQVTKMLDDEPSLQSMRSSVSIEKSAQTRFKSK